MPDTHTPHAAVDTYDTIPYPSLPFVQTHPNRLATVATLFGMTPPAIATCRVLELGCASGENLIPLALAMPNARFVGIDRSVVQIEQGRALAQTVEVPNLRLEAIDLMALPDDLGQFDYIIAHGLFSWVPERVRLRILEICQQHLQPHGIAYISYNTLPGWRIKGCVRDYLLFHTRRIQDPAERLQQGEAALDFLCKTIDAAAPIETMRTYAKPFDELNQVLKKTGDRGRSYMFHDYMEEVNEPFYFQHFNALAAQHGLQFVAESEVSAMFANGLPAAAQQVLAQLDGDPIEREQYLDFITARAFRQSLLSHAQAPLDRHIDPRRLFCLHIAGQFSYQAMESAEVPLALALAAPLTFKDGRGVEITIDSPLTKAALMTLGRVWPAAIAFDDLQAQARALAQPGKLVVQSQADYAQDTLQLAAELLRLFTAGCLELHVDPPRVVSMASARPRTSAWIRRCAAAGAQVTNLRHEGVDLSDVNRRLLTLLDGSRDRPALAAALARLVKHDDLVVLDDGRRITDEAELREVLAQGLDSNLDKAAKLALLEA